MATWMSGGRTALEGSGVRRWAGDGGPFRATDHATGRGRRQGRASRRRFAAQLIGQLVRTDRTRFTAVTRGKRGIISTWRAASGRDVISACGAGPPRHCYPELPSRVMRALGSIIPALAAGPPTRFHASISGYGTTGPTASKRNIDLVAHGVSRIDVGAR